MALSLPRQIGKLSTMAVTSGVTTGGVTFQLTVLLVVLLIEALPRVGSFGNSRCLTNCLTLTEQVTTVRGVVVVFTVVQLPVGVALEGDALPWIRLDVALLSVPLIVKGY